MPAVIEFLNNRVKNLSGDNKVHIIGLSGGSHGEMLADGQRVSLGIWDVPNRTTHVMQVDSILLNGVRYRSEVATGNRRLIEAGKDCLIITPSGRIDLAVGTEKGFDLTFDWNGDKRVMNYTTTVDWLRCDSFALEGQPLILQAISY